jgi:hypothetical protein
MATYQNTSLDTTKLILGNYKIEVASVGTTVLGTWVNLGAGIVNSYGHKIVKYDTQAGNAPDPVEGIADETFPVTGEMIEYDSSVLAAISGGAITSAAGGSGVTILHGGGNTTITEKAFKLTNRRLISGVTHETVIIVYNATLDDGPSFTAKSDNDADPVNVMPFAITGKNLSTLSAGSQLYSITRTYNP